MNAIKFFIGMWVVCKGEIYKITDINKYANKRTVTLTIQTVDESDTEFSLEAKPTEVRPFFLQEGSAFKVQLDGAEPKFKLSSILLLTSDNDYIVKVHKPDQFTGHGTSKTSTLTEKFTRYAED